MRLIISSFFSGLIDILNAPKFCYHADQYLNANEAVRSSSAQSSGRRRLRPVSESDELLYSSGHSSSKTVPNLIKNESLCQLLLRMIKWNFLFFIVSFVLMSLTIDYILPLLAYALNDILRKNQIELISRVGTWLFRVFWHTPVFYIMELINLICLKEITDKMKLLDRLDKTSDDKKYIDGRSIGYGISNRIFGIIFEIIFPLQSRILCEFMPVFFLQLIVQLFHYSLLYSIYGFGYRWSRSGLDFQARCHQIEMLWPYLLGFGLPLGLLRVVWPDYLSFGGLVIILYYPLLVIGAQKPRPMQQYFVHGASCLLVHWLLYPSVLFSSYIIRIIQWICTSILRYRLQQLPVGLLL